ncbi:MAG: DUF4184 family protein [Steroidobacteraceae bacterium]
MPVTPFHFGPGAAIHAIAPRQISFLAFCAANVLTDVEPLYYMLTGQGHPHRFLHTYVGATLTALATCWLFVAALRLAKKLPLPNIFNWQSLTLPAVAMGAFIGTYSHIVLDSIMHADIRPLAPFSDINPLLGLISLRALQGVCVVSGVLALAVLGIRRVLRR